ncbi:MULTISPECIES: hypothetical protein [Bartonella]|uniref:hypothetical protein n=1 Tax=Bartonella TaxID=773 RepID=UPI0018DC2BE0|nr:MULTISPECIES: hypothetical protein [Bartonella]MBH9993797.1 hypothetical protein [Bartonella sp. P0291]MBH9997857.1 hypothetical protein [Bartonella sp. M0192]MBI0000016.1 hypothetical protein [Bartonella sp. M0191]MBI0007579.1 hypothetical protein [Bartonella sp. M0193]MBI0011307.1 hypothetical protein [Bartonella sp. M0176]
MEIFLSLIGLLGVVGFLVGIVMLFKKQWRKNGLRFFVGGIILFVLATGFLPDKDETARKAGFDNAADENKAQSYGIVDSNTWHNQKAALIEKESQKKKKELETRQKKDLFYLIPEDESSFISSLQSAREKYTHSTNDLAKGGVRRERAKAVCKAVPIPMVKNWVGTITELTTNGDGLGVVSVQLSSDVFVKTWNNALSDVFDKTLLDPDSQVFKNLSKLNKGEKIRFSGQFLKDSQTVDCYREASLSMDGSMEKPEYIFRFSSVSVFQDNNNQSEGE